MERIDLLSESDLSDNLENSSKYYIYEDLHQVSDDGKEYIQNLKFVSMLDPNITRIVRMFKTLSVMTYYSSGSVGGVGDVAIHGYDLFSRSVNAYNFAPENKRFRAKTLLNYSKNCLVI